MRGISALWYKIFSISLVIYVISLSFLYAQEFDKVDTLESVLIFDDEIEKVTHIASNYVNRQELRGSYSNDVGEYLRNIPNISGIRKGGASLDPVVRGYKFSQLNVILNSGIKIENGCPNRMDPVNAHVEVEDIENIEVIKGPFSLKYGPSFGGVINLVTENPKPYEEFEIHADALLGYESNWGGGKFHGSVHGGNSKVNFQLTGGYREYGDYLSGQIEEGPKTIKSSFTKYNYSAKLGFSFTPKHSLIFSYLSSQGRDVMFPALPMDEKMDDTQIFSADYIMGSISPVIKLLDVKFYRSEVKHIMDNSQRPSYAEMQMVADVDALNTGGRAAITMQVSKHQILTGIDYEHIRKDGVRTGIMEMMGTVSVKQKKLWNDAQIENLGLFGEYKTSFLSYDFIASIRGDLNLASSGDTMKIIHDGKDYFNNMGSQFLNFSGSLGITKRFNPGLSVSLAFGRGTRSPNMLERYIKLLPVGYDSYDYLGNPQLKPETNNEFDLTFHSNNELRGSVYLNFFYSYVQDFITATLLPPSVITPQSQGVLGVKQFTNTDYITSKGFEFGYRTPDKYRLGGGITTAYTYAVIPSVTKYIITDGEVTDAVQIEDDALPEIPPLEANMNVYYKFLDGNLVPKLALRCVADQNHISEAFYEESTPGFALINFSVKYNPSQNIVINAGVNNVLNRSYYEHLNRRIIGTKENLYEPGRVIFVTLNLSI